MSSPPNDLICFGHATGSDESEPVSLSSFGGLRTISVRMSYSRRGDEDADSFRTF